MSAQLQKSQLQMFKDLLNVTFSPESEDGHSHCNSQEYRQVQDCGPEAHRVNHSVPQENNWDNSMSDTLPRCSSISSASAALQSSLGNKLQQQLENRGCAIYKLTWKEKTTPSGLPYFQLVASVPRTNETDYSSGQSYWYTPTTNIFPQPDTTRGLQTLAGQAKHLTNWSTPIVNDTTGSTHCYSGKDRKICLKLPGQVKLVLPIRFTASGQMLTGSDAGMESLGQLNPAHSRWLMGFPPEWDDCAVMAMPSSRKSQQNS